METDHPQTVDDLFFCFGVLNPKGQDDEEVTALLTESQLHQIATNVNTNDADKVPLFINHATKGVNGEPAIPCGHLQYAQVSPTGKLVGGVIIYDTPEGKLAADMVRSQKTPMNEFSLGFDVVFETKEFEGKTIKIPVANRLREVSFCHVGDRKDTKVLLVDTVGGVRKKARLSSTSAVASARQPGYIVTRPPILPWGPENITPLVPISVDRNKSCYYSKTLYEKQLMNLQENIRKFNKFIS